MKFLSIALVLLLFSFSTETHITEHQLKSATITWTGSDATGSYKPTGTLTHKFGNFRHNHGNLVGGLVVIDMTSLSTENSDMEAHLKNEDFFDVENYPEAKFEMQSAQLQNAKGKLKGIMTIKGKSLEVEADAEFIQKGQGYQVKSSLNLDRTKFGITYNSASYFKKLKDNIVADEFSVELDLYFE
ncbi:MAG: YceI family protein [Bacteroidota bacterium]